MILCREETIISIPSKMYGINAILWKKLSFILKIFKIKGNDQIIKWLQEMLLWKDSFAFSYLLLEFLTTATNPIYFSRDLVGGFSGIHIGWHILWVFLKGSGEAPQPEFSFMREQVCSSKECALLELLALPYKLRSFWYLHVLHVCSLWIVLFEKVFHSYASLSIRQGDWAY